MSITAARGSTAASEETARPLAEREVSELAAELARRELAPRALALDERRPGALDGAWEQVAAVGLDRALLPAEAGGAGLDAGALLACIEEIAVGEAGVAMLVLLSNAALAAASGEPAARIDDGERWTLVPAPPAALATGARIRITARPTARTVSGGIAPAPGALGADRLVVVTRTPTDLAVLAVDAGGLAVEESGPQLGLRAAAAARLQFLEVAVASPPAPGERAGAAAGALDLLRAGAAAIAHGVARRAQELADEYARERVQGGVAIIEHDAVREMLAAMTVRLAAAPDPALALAAGREASLAAKVAATDAAVLTTTDAVQVFGGSGYMHETGVEKLMRDAKCLQLWPEPNWVARDELVEASG